MNNTLYIKLKNLGPTYVGMIDHMVSESYHHTELPDVWPEFHCSIPLDHISFISPCRCYQWTQYRTFYVPNDNWCGHYIVHVKTKDPMIEYATHAEYYATYEDLVAHVPDANSYSKLINDIAIGTCKSVEQVMEDLRWLQSFLSAKL